MIPWLIPFIKTVLKWWKTSAEDKSGHASGRRLSALFITVLVYIPGRLLYIFYIMSVGVSLLITEKGENLHNDLVSTFYWLLWGFATDLIFIGFLWGYITQQGIIEFKNGSSSKKELTEESKTNQDQ
jgi:hypothetical protein